MRSISPATTALAWYATPSLSHGSSPPLSLLSLLFLYFSLRDSSLPLSPSLLPSPPILSLLFLYFSHRDSSFLLSLSPPTLSSSPSSPFQFSRQFSVSFSPSLLWFISSPPLSLLSPLPPLPSPSSSFTSVFLASSRCLLLSLSPVIHLLSYPLLSLLFLLLQFS